MKKIIALLLLLTLLLSTLSCSCNDEELGERKTKQGILVDYFQFGLYYSLPESFIQKNYSDGDINYLYEDGEGYGDGYFFFEAFPREDIEEDLRENPDITVYEFANQFYIINDFDRWEYYEENDMAVLEADEFLFAEEGDEDAIPEYFRAIVVRSTECLYVIHMTCYSDNIDDFRDTFDKIQKSIAVQEAASE